MPADDTAFQHDVIDRLGRIETKLDNDFRAIHGNGHPGLLDRVAKLEEDIHLLQSKGRWYRDWLGWIVAFGLAVAELAVKWK